MRYEIKNSKDNPDIRYIRENGKRLCDVNLTSRKIYFYEEIMRTLNRTLFARLFYGIESMGVGILTFNEAKGV